MFAGSMRNAAVINFVKEDPLGKRLTLGLRVTRAVYCVDGFKGFYRWETSLHPFHVMKHLVRFIINLAVVMCALG